MKAMDNIHQICLPVNIIVQTTNTITFPDEDKDGVIYPNISLLVISAKIMGVIVHRLLMNNGNFCNVLFKDTLDKLETLSTTLSLTNMW